MKKTLFTLFIFIFFLFGCAYVEGVKEQKKVTPIPPGEAPQQPPPSLAPIPGGSAATVEAAKIISPAAR